MIPKRRLTPKRRVIAVVATAGAALCMAVGSLTAWRTQRALQQALHRAAESVNAEENFGVVVRPLSPAGDSRFEWLPAPAVFTGGAIFGGHIYLCGPAGLFEYGSDGGLLKSFRTGRELPAARLTAMITGTLSDARGPELLIGTQGAGVLAWDGAHFRQIAALSSRGRGGLDTDANTVTALLPLTSGRLLVGTAKLGVLVYDGQRMRYFHSTLKNLSITALAGDETELWVGTLNHGAYRWQGGEAEQIAEAQGLPDPHVNAIAPGDGAAYVATAMGVAEVVQGRVQRVLAEGVFAQVISVEGKALAVGSFDQGLMDVPLAGARRGIRPLLAGGAGARGEGSEAASIVQMFSENGTLYAVASNELYARRAGEGWQKAISMTPSMLTDSDVSALAVDDGGRVWVGYFDRGLDMVSADVSHASHMEDSHIFCINRIVPDSTRHTVDVATANGLAIFDADGREREVMGKAAGLIAEDATDVALYRGGMAVATPAGLTFVDAAGAHSLYAFQGLVNNHVYALAMRGDRLMAGTLGGLSILDADNVSRNLTTATSGLKHNWITAVVPVEDGWLVGTYGAGVEHLDAQDRFDATEATQAGVEVNPNAMLVTTNHVLAGTLGSGLMVLNRRTQRWKTVTAGLPSLNVTAFAARGGTIYIGTDNGLVKVQEARLDE
jgi:ligand-binding sensor domain-containing protein